MLSAIGEELEENVIPKLPGTFFTAAVLHSIHGFIVCFFTTYTAISLLRLLAIDIVLILNPGFFAEKILNLLGHDYWLNSLLFYTTLIGYVN
jgi:hypothetical protein